MLKELREDFKRIRESNRKADLKLKARIATIRYNDLCAEFDCGRSLAEHISPRVATARAERDDAFKALAEVDPDFKSILLKYDEFKNLCLK